MYLCCPPKCILPLREVNGMEGCPLFKPSVFMIYHYKDNNDIAIVHDNDYNDIVILKTRCVNIVCGSAVKQSLLGSMIRIVCENNYKNFQNFWVCYSMLSTEV